MRKNAEHPRIDVTMGVYIHECDAAPVIHLAARDETIGTLTPRFEGEDLKGWQWADRFDIPIAGEGACDHMLTWLDGLPSIMRYYERIDGYSDFMSEYFQRYGIGWLKCGDHKLKITAKKVEVSSLERIGFLALIDEDSNDLIEGIRNDAAALNERLAYRTSEGLHET